MLIECSVVVLSCRLLYCCIWCSSSYSSSFPTVSVWSQTRPLHLLIKWGRRWKVNRVSETNSRIKPDAIPCHKQKQYRSSGTGDEEDVVVPSSRCLHSSCVGVLVVLAMIVAYRTNSIKIPKTTICVYIHIYIQYQKYKDTDRQKLHKYQ